MGIGAVDPQASEDPALELADVVSRPAHAPDPAQWADALAGVDPVHLAERDGFGTVARSQHESIGPEFVGQAEIPGREQRQRGGDRQQRDAEQRE